jgi:hypothetical protein
MKNQCENRAKDPKTRIGGQILPRHNEQLG